MFPSMNTTHSTAATQVMQTVAMPAPEEALPESWFDSAPRLSTVPPARMSTIPGEFLGDELADAWLR